MDIAVRARNIELTTELRSAAEQKVIRVSRVLRGMDRAEVRFLEQRNARVAEREVCEVTMHGHGHVVRARAAGCDWFVAVGRSTEKLERQLERLKARLADRARPVCGPSVHSGCEEGANAGVDQEDPRIVKTERFPIRPMTPEEAALQMDRVGHDVYLFVNAENGSTGVVYRRSDGHIGLIDAG